MVPTKPSVKGKSRPAAPESGTASSTSKGLKPEGTNVEFAEQEEVMQASARVQEKIAETLKILAEN